MTTRYEYHYLPGTFQLTRKITRLPAIAKGQNGSGVSNLQSQWYDANGRLVQSQCPRGFITQNSYDPASGALLQTIQDAGYSAYPASSSSSESSESSSGSESSFSSASAAPLHLVTDYQVDSQGRVTQVLGPLHAIPMPGNTADIIWVRTAQWTVYRDRVDDDGLTWHETLTAQGYYQPEGQSFTLVNPVSISRTAASNRRSEQIQAVRASSAGPLMPSDLFAQSTYTRWSVSLSNDAGQLLASRSYHAIPAAGDGLEGANYDETFYSYDDLGRQHRVRSPGGTVTRSVFDTLDRVVATYVGSSDVAATDADPSGGGDPANDMVCTANQSYDSYGRPIQQIQHVDDNPAHDRVTTTGYDSRGRVNFIQGPSGLCQVLQYDDLDRQTDVAQYTADPAAGGLLISSTFSYYDNQGRVYSTVTYLADGSGVIQDTLTANTWYDCSGNAVKQQAAGSNVFTKNVIDAVGRTVETAVGYDLHEHTWEDALHLDGDTILQQTEFSYNAAGNLLQTLVRQRLHTDPADATGALQDLDASPQARLSFRGAWYDGIGRNIASADYGTDGYGVIDWIPQPSDSLLLSTTLYNERGEAFATTDPAGRQQQQTFDDAGRLVASIQNFVTGTPTLASPAQDVTVRYSYTPDGQIATLTAVNPATGDQVTQYVYGSTLCDALVARRDLLRAEIYPDSDNTADPLGDGPGGVYNRIEYGYDRQGEILRKRDQNGTLHVYEYDLLGRQIQDRVAGWAPAWMGWSAASAGPSTRRAGRPPSPATASPAASAGVRLSTRCSSNTMSSIRWWPTTSSTRGWSTWPARPASSTSTTPRPTASGPWPPCIPTAARWSSATA